MLKRKHKPRYFHITYNCKIVDMMECKEYDTIGNLICSGYTIPSREWINKQLLEENLSNPSIIGIFEFKNRKDYKSFIKKEEPKFEFKFQY